MNGPIRRRGQCSQFNMGTGMRQTASHQRWQHASSSSMLTFPIWAQGYSCKSIIPYVHNQTPFFLCRLKIDHTRLDGEHAFIFQNSAVPNITAHVEYIHQRWAPAIFPQSASAGPLFRNSASTQRLSTIFKNLLVRQRWSAIPLPLFFPQCAGSAVTSPLFCYRYFFHRAHL